MAHATWTDAAKADYRGIARYIVDRDQHRRVARKVTREIREKCDHYARHPHTGTSRSEFGEGSARCSQPLGDSLSADR